MPNWCSCVIVIKGNPEGLSKFKKTLINPNPEDEELFFSFNSTVPRPKEEDENWYEWNNKNWGTKWDVSDYTIENNEDCVTIWTETAWCPPNKWAKKVIKHFDNNLEISIAYIEMGMGYWGKYTVDKEGEFDDCFDLEDQKHIKWNDDDSSPILKGIFKDFYENNRLLSLSG